ncbi:CCAAT/enhancer-binding protein gamma isoform X2 [Monodelphis domestica]|uniref:CCAAT/enhancer-binding protein gamma isoform X2 n=1 Tax=Monodelphis domestica TaxID=13616 RepID=UPI0024E24B00|nr:CCAAT/enhancer-binding protein gamma isoform X2 [Monodelphis domestica]
MFSLGRSERVPTIVAGCLGQGVFSNYCSLTGKARTHHAQYGTESETTRGLPPGQGHLGTAAPIPARRKPSLTRLRSHSESQPTAREKSLARGVQLWGKGGEGRSLERFSHTFPGSVTLRQTEIPESRPLPEHQLTIGLQRCQLWTEVSSSSGMGFSHWPRRWWFVNVH